MKPRIRWRTVYRHNKRLSDILSANTATTTEGTHEQRRDVVFLLWGWLPIRKVVAVRDYTPGYRKVWQHIADGVSIQVNVPATAPTPPPDATDTTAGG